MRGERLRSTLLIQNVVRRAKSKEQNQNTQIVMVFEETAPSAAAAADSCHDLNECGHAIIINLKNHLLTLRDIKKKNNNKQPALNNLMSKWIVCQILEASIIVIFADLL